MNYHFQRRRRRKVKNKRNQIILAVILMCIILFLVFAFSNDKDLQKEVVQQATEIAQDIATYEMTEEDLIYTLEHEIDLYKNWKEEGFKNQQEVSYINKNNIRKVNGLLKRYYNKNGN